MASVYSVSVFEIQGLTGSSSPYGVPAGKTLIIRDVCVYIGQGLSTYQVRLKDDTVGQTFYNHEGSTINAPDYDHQDMRTVIPEGHVVRAETDGHPVDVTVSGYLLTA